MKGAGVCSCSLEISLPGPSLKTRDELWWMWPRELPSFHPFSEPWCGAGTKKAEAGGIQVQPVPPPGNSHSRIPAGYHSNGHFVSAYRGNCSSSAEFSPPPQAISTENARAAPSPPFLSLSLAADDCSPHGASQLSPWLRCRAKRSKRSGGNSLHPWKHQSVLSFPQAPASCVSPGGEVSH